MAVKHHVTYHFIAKIRWMTSTISAEFRRDRGVVVARKTLLDMILNIYAVSAESML